MAAEPAADRDVDALFGAHHRELLRYAARRVGPDTAPDVVADVFLVAWRRRDDLPTEGVLPWLYGIAHRVVANHQRGERRRLRLRARLAAEPLPATAPEHDHVHRALAKLAPADQEVLRLTEWEQLDTDEAAAVLGCSSGALRVRLHRARRKFAAVLATLDEED